MTAIKRLTVKDLHFTDDLTYFRYLPMKYLAIPGRVAIDYMTECLGNSDKISVPTYSVVLVKTEIRGIVHLRFQKIGRKVSSELCQIYSF